MGDGDHAKIKITVSRRKVIMVVLLMIVDGGRSLGLGPEAGWLPLLTGHQKCPRASGQVSLSAPGHVNSRGSIVAV